ncbi:MAG: L,D-transpeptidase family protein [Elusimicrobiota bacterium]
MKYFLLAVFLFANLIIGQEVFGKEYKTFILVDTKSGKMELWQDSKSIKKYRVAIGRGGVNKHQQNDNKTPLGNYSIGSPRPSRRFSIFIPLNYPTAEQISKGYTGGNIGIHGPHRLFKKLGTINTWFNWTQGCIAVGTEREILDIANWMKKQKVNKVIIK